MGGPVRARERAFAAVLELVKGTARWLADAVGEILFALFACLTLAGLVAAFRWGWVRQPAVTVALCLTVVAFRGFGAWSLRSTATTRHRISRLAAGAALVAAIWAGTVLAYCNCW